MLIHQLIYQGLPEAIAFAGQSPVTYSQLQQHVEKYRNFFYHQGIREGENVGLFSRNSPEFVYSYMAIISLGAVVVPINFQLTAREIAYIASDAKMKHIVTYTPLDLPLQQLVIPDFKNEVANASYDNAPSLPAEWPDTHSCVIIYTSGTTGNPKGAVLTHRNLFFNSEAFGKLLPSTAQDNVLCVLPMYHCFAWTCSVLNPLQNGASITILEAFAPKETLAAIKDYAVTIMFGVPPMYNFLIRVGEKEDLAGIKYLVSGGASLPETIARQFQEKYGHHIIEGYGLSEASPVVTVNPPGKVKYTSIGVALPGLEVKILGSKGEALAPGVVGELVVQGPSVMKGYYNLPKETAKALRNGWLHTGDVAYRDTEGYYHIVDRIKDMIIINGENVYPREIEELLYAYPGITEAAVIGMADELRGQAARAYLVFAEGHQFNKKALREYLQPKLAAYKVPRDFVVMDVLPKNQTGKILKRVLREMATSQPENE